MTTVVVATAAAVVVATLAGWLLTRRSGSIREIHSAKGPDPDTANQTVPDDKRDAVLHAFSTTLPNQTLPFGVAPTSEGARGSDVIIEGITYGVNVTLEGFKQS